MTKKKVSTLLVAAITAASVMGITACGGTHEHDWVVDTSKSVPATCGEAGVTYYKCSGCDETYSEVVSATANHNFGTDKVCSSCGYIDMSGVEAEEAIAAYGFYHKDVDGSKTYSTGDTVYFGSYPQDLVEDEDLIASLNANADTPPEAGAETFGNWTSYAYYSEGEKSDYMFYEDISYEGKEYRGVYMQKYRPYFSGFAAYDGETDADKNNSVIQEGGFELGVVYWFEFSPVSWAVLGYENGNLLLNADICLDSQPFQAQYGGTTSNVVIPGTETPVNDWESSTVRSFLNNEFLNAAFNEKEQAMIQTASLDNKTSGYKADAPYQVRQENTQDKIFLLSYQDLINPDYGFPTKASYDDEVQNSENGKNEIYDYTENDDLFVAMLRRRSYTAYSTSQGLHISTVAHAINGGGACWYLLRSAGSTTFGVAGVNKYGSIIYSRPVDLSGVLAGTNPTSEDALAICGNYGILPSLYLKVGK